MTNIGTLDRALSRTSVNALWWRVPTWVALTVASVLATHGVAHRIAAAVIMSVSAATLQFVNSERVRVRQAAILVSTAGGLAATLVAPNGLAEVLVVVATGRSATAFEGRALQAFVVLDTIAFGATIGIITGSLAGVLAGTGIPLLVQRAVEHRDLVRERDRAQALLAEVQNARESETQRAALQERGRIAREMHDVLAHSLAGLSVQLQAVRALAAREHVTESVLGPLDKAATLARDGLAEARAAVSTLRDPVGLGLDALPALVERHPGVASLLTDGSPGIVSPEAGHALYRAVQESLTNAARYAPGSPVAVSLTWHPDSLDVAVTDSGPAPGRSAVGGQGTGLGLAGMAERIAQVGGTVRAGPAPHGGWQVALTVPTQVDEEVR